MWKDPECENIYEKWLRRRFNYTCIRNTGQHCPPLLLHQLLHEGHAKEDVNRELKHRLWTFCRYPNSQYFNGLPTLYRYPDEVEELLDFRFFNSNRMPGSCQSEQLVDGEQVLNLGTKSHEVKDDGCTSSHAYDLSLREVIEVPHWDNDSRLLPDCPYPHLRERPLSWHLPGDRQSITEENDAQTTMFPICCYQDHVCCTVHCRDPIPQVVHCPGPWVAKDIKLLWR